MGNTLLTANEIFNKFKSDINNKSIGKINFSLNGISIDLEIKDIIGNVLQAWFGKWLKINNIYYTTKPNTQEFPDFIISTNIKNGMLEFKSFDSTKSPNFDVANFDSYCRSLLTDSYRLDADYLIVSYKLTGADITIENMWLKKIWEICTSSERFALKTQVKQDTIVNIRPATWYSSSASFKPFKTKEDFLLAIYKTLKVYDRNNNDADEWLDKVYNNYTKHTGTRLNINLVKSSV